MINLSATDGRGPGRTYGGRTRAVAPSRPVIKRQCPAAFVMNPLFVAEISPPLSLSLSLFPYLYIIVVYAFKIELLFSVKI